MRTLILCIVYGLMMASARDLPRVVAGGVPASARDLPRVAAHGPEAAAGGALASPRKPAAFPQATISNGLIHIRLYLPDTADGYYRGSRFDWSGVMPELTCQGHTWCGQWFEQYAPTTHDAVMGPVESFSPLGYDQAAPGGRFVAIGIGVLANETAAPYNSFHYYHVVDPGRWAVKTEKNSISFTQTLRDTAYAYDYNKTLFLPRGKSILEIVHTLKNRGNKVIEISVYDHNLFLIDGQPTGPGTVLSFAFPLSGDEERGIGTLAEMKGNQLIFAQTPARKQDLYAVLHGYGPTAKDYDIRIENRHTGAGVRITCDQPLSKLVCWASSTVACPEPYIHLTVPPGQTVSWTINYQFYTIKSDIHE